jgi:leukotriene-A4 hydrolase
VYYLESLTGKDIFRQIMKSYISTFRLQSIEYTDWKNHFINEVNSRFDKESALNILKKVDWDTWIFTPGYPIVKNDFNNTYSTEAQIRLNDLFNGLTKDDFPQVFKDWLTTVKIVFLNLVATNLNKFSEENYVYFRDTLKLSTDYNMEIKNIWFQISLNTNHKDILPNIIDFLGKIGRMKYIRPIYKAFASVDKTQAYDVFLKLK